MAQIKSLVHLTFGSPDNPHNSGFNTGLRRPKVLDDYYKKKESSQQG
jgi:hypothetical protein